MLEAISSLLATLYADLALTEGENLFLHSIPADVSKAVMVRYYFGGIYINWELPGYRKTPFQIVVRDTDYASGYALAKGISDALTREGDKGDLAGIFVNYIRPRIEPMVFPKSVGNEWEFLVTFDACYCVLE